MLKFEVAKSVKQFEMGKKLFKLYANELGIDLSFQDFNVELENIDKQYNTPEGALLIAYSKDNCAIGCLGIRKIDPDHCELKRMYIIPEYRKKGIGTKLMEASFKIGTELGYKKIRLDTLSTMKSAIRLYENHGFYEIEAYRYNPINGAKYYEKKLIH